MKFTQDIELRSPIRRACTLLAECECSQGTVADYKALSRFHYRNTGNPPGLKAVYRAIHVPTGTIAAAVVFTAPALQLAARNAVFGDRYKNVPGDKALTTRSCQRINEEIELLMRIVVHPTFRGIGLAQKLTRHACPLRPTIFIEVSAAMGRVNPFLARAGFAEYEVAMPPRTTSLLAYLRAYGATDATITDPVATTAWLARLGEAARNTVEREMLKWERTWATLRRSPDRTGKDRMEEVTLENAIRRIANSTLVQPRYYLWKNTPDQGTVHAPQQGTIHAAS